MKKNKNIENIENNAVAPKKQKGRKLKYSILSTSIVLVFLAVVIAVNAVATLLLERYPITLDVTTDKIYEMDKKTIDYVKSLDMDVDITILLTKSEFETFLSSIGGSDYITQSEELFKKFEQYNSKLNIEFLDVNKNPDFVAKFEEEVGQGNIVFESELRNKIGSVYDLYNVKLDETAYYTTGQESYMVDSSKIEETMLSGLMFVTDEDPVRAAVIKGHTEAEMTYLPTVLGSNNYEMSDVRLISEELTDEYDAVIIAAPTTDFTDAEIKKLDKFLNNNGKFEKNLIYFASASQPKLPRIEAYLEQEWGISIGDGYLIETDSSYYATGQENVLLMSYVDETYSSVIADPKNSLLIGNDVRPLTATFSENGNRKTSVLFQSQKSAVVKPSNAGDKWKSKDGKKAAYAGGIVTTRESVYNNDKVESTVAVIGSLDIMDGMFTYSQYNQQYAVNMFDQMTERDSGITVLSKTVTYNKMNLTKQNTNVIGVIFIGIIPVICLIAGFIIFLRRRHK